jgi:hypothetical protein
MTTTNLGNIASCKVLTASTSVISPSFTQPSISIGTITVPSAVGYTLAYVSGTNRYEYYYAAGATTVALAATFELTGLPINVLADFHIDASVNWALVGATTTVATLPVYSSSISVQNDTDSTSTAFVKVASTVSPVFSAGTAVYKIVISLNAEV